MRKLFSLAATGFALAKGVIAFNSFLKTRRRAQSKAVASDALEIRTSDGQTVIYKPVDAEGRQVDTVEEAVEGVTPKTPSRMALGKSDNNGERRQALRSIDASSAVMRG